MNQLKGERGEWYVVGQILLFLLIIFGPRENRIISRWVGQLAQFGFIIGLIIGLIGVGFFGWGLLNLGRNLTPLPHPKEDSRLVQQGAYRVVRHPIYSGLIMGAIGWAGLESSPLMLMYAFILFIFFDLKTRREEAWLTAKFSEYGAYQQRVKKLIPFVY